MKVKLLIAAFLFCSASFGQGKFFGGNGDGFATTSVTDVVLPLQLADFSGRANGNTNILLWGTLSESNNHVFEIERSADGIIFGKIGEVSASGNSNSLRQYQFVDDKLVAEQYYYRLKQIDIDGRFSFSNIISLANRNNKNNINVIPNPVVNRATVLFRVSLVNEEFLLINSNGQMIEKLEVNGNNATIDLTGRSAGLYLLVNRKLSISCKINKTSE